MAWTEEERRAYNKQYYLKNRESNLMRNRIWRAQNEQYCKKMSKYYYERNKEGHKAYGIKWRAKNADKFKEYNKNYYEKHKKNYNWRYYVKRRRKEVLAELLIKMNST